MNQLYRTATQTQDMTETRHFHEQDMHEQEHTTVHMNQEQQQAFHITVNTQRRGDSSFRSRNHRVEQEQHYERYNPSMSGSAA